MPQFGFAQPGYTANSETSENEILWGGDRSQALALFKSAVYSGAARDAGNSPTTELRRGLIVGKVTSTGEYEEWDADASDGTQYIEGIVYDFQPRMTDRDGNNADRVGPVLVRGPVKAANLYIEGTAFTSHANEHLARRQMVAAGFIFDDDPMGYLAGTPRFATVSGTSDTLTHDENGSTIFYSSSSAVAVTLPALRPGLSYDIVRTGDEEIVISSAAGDDIVFGNDASGDSITFTTAGQHVGARVRLQSVYVGTTLKWLAEVVCTPFGTDVGGLTFGLAS